MILMSQLNAIQANDEKSKLCQSVDRVVCIRFYGLFYEIQTDSDIFTYNVITKSFSMSKIFQK